MSKNNDYAIVQKIEKNVISITFPEGTKGAIHERIPVDELLKVLSNGQQLSEDSKISIEKPVPVDPT